VRVHSCSLKKREKGGFGLQKIFEVRKAKFQNFSWFGLKTHNFFDESLFIPNPGFAALNTPKVRLLSFSTCTTWNVLGLQDVR